MPFRCIEPEPRNVGDGEICLRARRVRGVQQPSGHGDDPVLRDGSGLTFRVALDDLACPEAHGCLRPPSHRRIPRNCDLRAAFLPHPLPLPYYGVEPLPLGSHPIGGACDECRCHGSRLRLGRADGTGGGSRGVRKQGCLVRLDEYERVPDAAYELDERDDIAPSAAGVGEAAGMDLSPGGELLFSQVRTGRRGVRDRLG